MTNGLIELKGGVEDLEVVMKERESLVMRHELKYEEGFRVGSKGQKETHVAG